MGGADETMMATALLPARVERSTARMACSAASSHARGRGKSQSACTKHACVLAVRCAVWTMVHVDVDQGVHARYCSCRVSLFGSHACALGVACCPASGSAGA